jgi:hypothetical protein
MVSSRERFLAVALTSMLGATSQLLHESGNPPNGKRSPGVSSLNGHLLQRKNEKDRANRNSARSFWPSRNSDQQIEGRSFRVSLPASVEIHSPCHLHSGLPDFHLSLLGILATK